MSVTASAELWGRGFVYINDHSILKATSQIASADSLGASFSDGRGAGDAASHRSRPASSGQRTDSELPSFAGLASGRIVSSKFPVEICQFSEDL